MIGETPYVASLQKVYDIQHFDEQFMIAEITKRLEQLRDDIRDKISANGQRASGRTQESLKVLQQGNGVSLVGRKYFAAIETGTKPWSTANGKTFSPAFRDIIRQWIIDKGINVDDPDRAAAAISHKIINEGSRTYRQSGFNDVYTSLIPQAVHDIESLTTALMGAACDVVINKWKRRSAGEYGYIHQ